MRKMAEDNSSVLLEENLNKCFAEQITSQFDGLEENLEKLDCLFDLSTTQEEDRCKIEKLEKRVAESSDILVPQDNLIQD